MCGHEHDLQYIRRPSDTVSYIVSGGGSDVRYGEQVRWLAEGRLARERCAKCGQCGRIDLGCCQCSIVNKQAQLVM